MKAVRFRLVQIAVLCFLIWLPNSAVARTSVSIRFGSGYQHSRRSYRHDNRWRSHKSSRHNRSFKPVRSGWRRRHYRRPQVRTIVVGSGYWYCREPDYYAVRPRAHCRGVIAPLPQVIEKQVVLVQPKEYDENTPELFEELRYRKSELLKKLETGDKEQRKEAIDELAGFSFDDKVRQALENVLLSDPDAELRKEAAQAFGKVKNTKALAALEKARVEDSSEDVRKEADEAIKKLENN